MGSSGGCPPVRAKIPAEAAAVSSQSQGQEEECGKGRSTSAGSRGGSLCKGAEVQGQLLAHEQGGYECQLRGAAEQV